MAFLLDSFASSLRDSRISSEGPLDSSSHAGIVSAWFSKYNSTIPRKGTRAIAFLSCVFPERRSDRVLGLRERQLETIIQRAHCLGSSRMLELQSIQSSGQLDFAASVERVVAKTDCEPRVGSELTLEEIDDTLDQVAALSSFSSANLRDAVREKHDQLSSANELFSKVFVRMKSFEAK